MCRPGSATTTAQHPTIDRLTPFSNPHHTPTKVNVDNNLVGWYRTMQLGHFSEHGVKTEGGPGGLRSQRTLFDCPPALAVRGCVN